MRPPILQVECVLWGINMKIKHFFCKHNNIEFVRNIYGDEINKISTSHIYRSAWRCKYCGKILYSGYLNNYYINPNFQDKK